jgi:1,4-dihydroxy-2-naphthoate octaprenyltransferase
MSEFITVERSHPQFKDYLSGEFSSEYRALPVRSLNIDRASEKVTFQIVKVGDLDKPSLPLVLAQIFRLDLLTLTLTPAATVAALLANQLTEPHLIFLTLLSLAFLHGAAFSRNDFVDHMRGIDRLNEKGGSRVIQKGWLRAITVQRLYWGLLVIATLLAAPVLTRMPELIFLAIAVAGLGVLGYSKLRWGSGHWMFGDLAVFLCLGPMLALGMSWVVAREVSGFMTWVGVYFGLLSLAYLEIRHTISNVVDDEAGLATLPVRWGFDRAKLVIVGLLVAAAVLAAYLISIVQPGPLSLLGLPLVAALAWVAQKGFAVSSPLSSGLYELPKKVAQVHLVSGFYLILVSML